MSKLGELYAPRHLSGELSLDYVARRLKTPALKKQFCSWFVERMVFTDVRSGQHWPPYENSPAELYSAVRGLLGHAYLSGHTAKLIFSESEGLSDQADDLIAKICIDSPSSLVALVTHADTQLNPYSSIALRRLLDAGSQTVWLDATKTTKIKKQLYQFTKWRAVLEIIPRRERGQILQEELGL